MFPIQEIDDVMLAFPANVMNLMPKYEDIPEEFKRGGTKWNRLFYEWFFNGLESLELKPKDGVDTQKATRHIRAVMTSFQPKHEHKSAAVAFLLSEWFKDAKWKAKEKRG